MAINLNIKICMGTCELPPEKRIQASCNSPDTGGDCNYIGYGGNPYAALHDLINKFQEDEVWWGGES
jgi:hypothetical protein